MYVRGFEEALTGFAQQELLPALVLLSYIYMTVRVILNALHSRHSLSLEKQLAAWHEDERYRTLGRRELGASIVQM